MVGFYQDWKSENILASLKNLIIEKCYAIRSGNKIEIPSVALVPGDVVFLNEGDGVPEDIRLIGHDHHSMQFKSAFSKSLHKFMLDA